MHKVKTRGNSEFYLNLFQKFHKELLEELIDEQLEDLLVEKYYFGQKIDLYAVVAGKSTEVFVESMTKKSDKRHLEFISMLIDNIEGDAIIIFQAEAFNDKIIATILDKIRKSGKGISFFAIEISRELIARMELLNQVHFLKVVDEVASMDILNPFTVVEKFINGKRNVNIEKSREIKKSKIERRNELMVKAIREKIHYFPTVQRERRCLENRIVTYGAGRTGVDYVISAEDRLGNAFVSLRFAEEAKATYGAIKQKRNGLKKLMSLAMDFDDKNLIIRTDVSENKFIYKTIDDIVDIFAKYVFFLSDYILYYGTEMEERMIIQNRERNF